MAGAHSLGAATLDALGQKYVLHDAPVWVDWPYATEARVVCVTTKAERVWRDKRSRLSRCDVHPTEWKELSASLHEQLRSNHAVECGDIHTVLYVVRLLGHSRLPDGTLVRRWAREPTPVPAQLVQPKPAHGDAGEPQALARAAAAARLSAGARVLILEGPNAGCVGVIDNVEAAAASTTAAAEAEAAAAAEAEKAAAEAAEEAKAVEEEAALAAAEAGGESEAPGPGASEEDQLAWAVQESLRVEAINQAADEPAANAPKKPAGPPAVAMPKQPALVEVKLRPRPPLPALPQVAPERGQAERDLAARLSLQPIVLARLSGSVTLVDSNGGKHEVGLGIKSRRQRLVAVGWVRLRSSGNTHTGERETWEYSGLAERTLRAYRAAFPSLFSLLEQRPKDEDYSVDEVFPASSFAGAEDSGWGPMASARAPEGKGDAGAKGGGLGSTTSADRLEELLAYLKATGVRAARLVPADMLRLSVDSVELAQTAIEKASADAATTPPKDLVTLKLPARAVLRPTDAGVHLGGLSTVHAPGEHVVHIRSSGPVPFGERGIVVAVQGTKVEVLFEREGYCGTGHFAQLRSCRGAVLPAAALLNLTRPLPAAYRLSAAGSHGARAAAAAGLKAPMVDSSSLSIGGGLSTMRKMHAGLPANIWTLLETMDAELKEPEWVQPAMPAEDVSYADADHADAMMHAGGRKARKARRDDRDAKLADLGDLSWM